MIVQCYQFNSRQCATSETVAGTLQRFASWQNIVTLGHLGQNVMGHVGVWHREPCSPEIFANQTKLTFTKAVTIAQAVELAEKGSKEIQSTGKDLPKNIHKFSHVTNSRNSQKHKDVAKDKPPACNCYRCGGKHSQSTCRFKSEVCHFCNKRGHIAKVCKTRMAQ